MAMDPKKQHKADLILAIGMGKKPPMGKDDAAPDSSDEGSGDDAHEALAAAMADFLKAVQAKDPDAMADAFKQADDVCEQYEDKPDEEDQEPEKG